MDNTLSPAADAATIEDDDAFGRILVGTGFALSSLILVPALAQSVGLGSSLTSAVRVALMKASNKV